jgi:hypothetical protein
MGETEQVNVIYSSKAIESITNLALFLSNKGYPETATTFCNKLYDFGDSLGILPHKYNICRFKLLSKYGFYCAVFKNWVFIHKIDNNRVYIMDVVHSSNLK